MYELPPQLPAEPIAIIQEYNSPAPKIKIPSSIKKQDALQSQDKLTYLVNKTSNSENISKLEFEERSKEIAGIISSQIPSLEKFYNHPTFIKFMNIKAQKLMKLPLAEIRANKFQNLPTYYLKNLEKDFALLLVNTPELEDLLPKLSSSNQLTLQLSKQRMIVIGSFQYDKKQNQNRVAKNANILRNTQTLDTLPTQPETINALRQKFPNAQKAPEL